jgi:3-hydroxyacyl-CoA dehydrogenase
LRSVARAERQAANLPVDLARVRAVPPDRIGLAGPPASDLVALARLALARGLEVVWQHPDPESAAANLAALDLAEASEQRAGRLSAAARVSGRTRLHDHGDAPVWFHSQQPADFGPETSVRVVLGEGGRFPGLVIAPRRGCCELALPKGGPPEGPALVLAVLRRLGLQPVLVGHRPILGRGLTIAGNSALMAMAAAGVPKARIAAALEGFGASRPERLPDPERIGPILEGDEILARWLGGIANEGLRLLAQGVALRASDIDLVLVLGHGFPRWRGGPMHQADRRGLMALRADLRSWAVDDPFWTPAPILDTLIRDGKSLDTLDLNA